MVNLTLKDDQFPNNGITHIRKVARAILVNSNHQICILKIDGEDIFGLRDYYETPGGGVEENESFEEAVVREIDEEVGVKAHVELFIGEIVDYYNLIYRKNINRYYLLREDEKTKIHHESKGDDVISQIIYVSLDDAISKYENLSNHGISKLIKQRELPILKELKKLIDNKLVNL